MQWIESGIVERIELGIVAVAVGAGAVVAVDYSLEGFEFRRSRFFKKRPICFVYHPDSDRLVVRMKRLEITKI
jgi:hypothetical protein